MIVFVDTNVIIDFYQRREPFFFPAATILDLAQSGHFEVSISTATILNSFYILRKNYDRTELYSKMRGLMSLVKVIDLDNLILRQTLADEWPDFEDCVQYCSAAVAHADVIVTRNPKDFQRSTIKVMDPSEFLDSLNS